MKKKSIQLNKYLRIINTVFMKVGVPTEFFNQIQIFVEICAINGVNLPKLFTFIFGLGYELMFSFYNRGGIKVVSEMLIIVRYMRAMFDEILQYQGREWFFESKSYLKLNELCEKHTVSPKKIFLFIDENRVDMLGDGKFLITAEKVEAIFEYYLQRNIQNS